MTAPDAATVLRSCLSAEMPFGERSCAQCSLVHVFELLKCTTSPQNPSFSARRTSLHGHALRFYYDRFGDPDAEGDHHSHDHDANRNGDARSLD